VTAPIVAKLGSTLVVDPQGRPRRKALREVAGELARARLEGTPVCVVSSGAIALGARRAGLDPRRLTLPRLQAASALGQAALQRAWQDAFSPFGVQAAQVLITAAEIADRKAYVNVRNALRALFDLEAIPILNENDATATDEITFGDNDALAAQVAVLLRARRLLLLTSVEGVMTELGAEVIADGADARRARIGAHSASGRGGMSSKINAAELAAEGGVASVIASLDALPALLRGERAGTAFAARPVRHSAFGLWLRYGRPPASAVEIDAGAAHALVESGKSLLAVGVVGWSRKFRSGDCVDVVADGRAVARGVSSVDSDQIVGRPPGVEVIHRDRLVLL
jgi:glutamate 5-kinase